MSLLRYTAAYLSDDAVEPPVSDLAVRGTSATATGSATSGGIDYPTGIADGDRGLLAAIYNTSLGTPTTPTGWVLESTHVITGTVEAGLYSRLMDGTETGSLSVAWPGTVQKTAWSMWVGAGVGAPSGHAWGSKALTTDTSMTVPAVTTPTTDHVLVTFLTERSSSASSSFTAPAGTTAGVAQFGSGGGAGSAGSAYSLTLDADGSVGAGTWGWSSAGSGNVAAVTVALPVIATSDAPALWVWNGTEYAAAQSVQVKHPVSGWITPAHLYRKQLVDGWRAIT